MLASIAEREQYRGIHTAKIQLLFLISMQKTEMLHFLKQNFCSFAVFVLPLYPKASRAGVERQPRQPSKDTTVAKVRCGSYDEPNAVSNSFEYC